MEIEKYISTSPAINIMFANAIIIKSMQKSVGESNCGFLEALVLVSIYFEKKDVRPSLLAETFKSSRSNISHIITKLEKKKYLKRILDETNAKSYILKLTPDGVKRVNKFVKFFDDLQKGIEKENSEKDIQKFVEQLQLLSNKINKFSGAKL